jgi:peroxiredoxin
LRTLRRGDYSHYLMVRSNKRRYDSLSSLLGKVVLIIVWAIGCPPCVRELPDLQRLQSTFKQKGLIVLIVSLDVSAHQRRLFKERNLRVGGIIRPYL